MGAEHWFLLGGGFVVGAALVWQYLRGTLR